MKLTNLFLSALSLIGLTLAQNGNDRIILNNRTGLSPVVYDTLATSYTKAAFLDANGLPVEIQPSPTLMMPVSAGKDVEKRIPPPEFFSTRIIVHVPGYAVPDATDNVTFNILPLPATPTPSSVYVAPVQTEWSVDCKFHYCPSQTINVPTTFFTTHPVATKTGHVTVTTTSFPAVPPEVPSVAGGETAGVVPSGWWRGAEGVVGMVLRC
ncbi:hypothetical protein N0V94_008265 [Neodidymelliopsis sp. IMI 364377]|nr:hypothetical protein N0V94_008265 [Neodidymelliopsis sp. IMI 364377]